MAINGPFSENELEKFQAIFKAQNEFNEKEVSRLIKKLTPLEEDRFDQYQRTIEEQIQKGEIPPITFQFSNRKTTKDHSSPKLTTAEKKDRCTIC